ncbi:MAG TPA: FAD-dependent monooxygenase [Polyangiaceae bacterium]|nr:FAD-dependent monooxygenase [Polyangiaceae bacterium]
MRILISGASVAGPVAAYWLRRHGFQPTLVERAPGPRKTGGHAVDLFRPAIEIVERMGVLPAIHAKRTDTDFLTLLGEGGGAGIEIELKRFLSAISDRHVEIMREDLSEVLQGATHGVEAIYGDSITALNERTDAVEVSFEHAPPREFDLVIGADGLHSNVRRLAFGPERQFTHYAGAYLAVVTVPNYLGLSDHTLLYRVPGRMIGLYAAKHFGDARAVFLWNSEQELGIHHRDIAGQKALLKRTFEDLGWELPRLLAELEHAPAFYFDSISQLHLQSWSKGRVSLVGDAGYCPGPAIGGSTSLAVVGAYVLAGELAAAQGDYTRAFAAAEDRLRDYVLASRTFALHTARQLIPRSRTELWLQARALRLLSVMPTRWARSLIELGRARTRLHDTVLVRDYGSEAQRATRTPQTSAA